MKLQDLKDKSILILGFGREGKSTLNFFNNHFPGKEIGIADEKKGKDYLDKLQDYDVVIKSPGIPYLPEIKKAKVQGKIITSATKIFFDNFKGKIIGVTGTKGKSTTASLIYEVLKSGGLDVYLAGNIGHPSLELLDRLDENSIVIYELSSFQLEDLNVSPHIAVITNIYPEHLDHHGNFGFYMEAKNNITRFQTERDYLIYNQDIEQLVEMAIQSKAKKLPFSKKDTKVIEKLIPKDDRPMLGDFNLLNIMPAMLIGRIFKLSDKKIIEGIINFIPLPHRLEFVGEFSGIRFYNDSLSTIPQATIAALSALKNNVQTLIAGGFDRGVDYSVLGPAIVKSKIKNLILFPTTGEKIWESVRQQATGISKYEVNNMEEAVKIAYEKTAPGKIALLSPASTSFNLFKDYEDRGNQFKKYVSLLGRD